MKDHSNVMNAVNHLNKVTGNFDDILQINHCLFCLVDTKSFETQSTHFRLKRYHCLYVTYIYIYKI